MHTHAQAQPPRRCKTFSELKDSRNSLKQVKRLKQVKTSAALQEGFRIIAIRVLLVETTRLLGLTFFADGVPHNEHNRDPESKPKL